MKNYNNRSFSYLNDSCISYFFSEKKNQKR